jgi:tRNA threonylcarbamoyladenosine biosynthesis protein TsaB
MLILGIETTTPLGSVALLDVAESGVGRLLGAFAASAAKAHSRLILAAIQSLLAEHHVALERLDAVAVSQGPGAFTGTRVGISVAKALCLTGSPPLVAVPTLTAFAHQLGDGTGSLTVMPILNAMKGEVYAQTFDPDGLGGLRARGEPMVTSPGELVTHWPERALIGGEGALAYAQHWAPLEAAGRVVWARADRSSPSAASVAWVGARLALQRQWADAGTLAPFYLRPAHDSLTVSPLAT